jgi:hypothetical protein
LARARLLSDVKLLKAERTRDIKNSKDARKVLLQDSVSDLSNLENNFDEKR